MYLFGVSGYEEAFILVGLLPMTCFFPRLFRLSAQLVEQILESTSFRHISGVQRCWPLWSLAHRFYIFTSSPITSVPLVTTSFPPNGYLYTYNTVTSRSLHIGSAFSFVRHRHFEFLLRAAMVWFLLRAAKWS